MSYSNYTLVCISIHKFINYTSILLHLMVVKKFYYTSKIINRVRDLVSVISPYL